MVIYEVLKGLGQSFVRSANQQTGFIIWGPADTEDTRDKSSSPVSELCSTHSISRVNFFRLSRNSLLPPWWKCRAGRREEESLSLNTRKVQPSFFTVTDFSSLMLKLNAHRLLSGLWFRQPEGQRDGENNADGAVHVTMYF